MTNPNTSARDVPRANDHSLPPVDRARLILARLDDRLERLVMLPGADRMPLPRLAGRYHDRAGWIERNVLSRNVAEIAFYSGALRLARAAFARYVDALEQCR